MSKRHVGKLQKENAELKQSASASTERKLHEKVIRLQAQLREYHRGEGDIESPEGLQDQLLEAHFGTLINGFHTEQREAVSC